MKPEYVALVFALLANAAANILIKEGMKGKALSFAEPWKLVADIALNPAVAAGVTLFALNVAAYAFVLSKVKLSAAYPIMTSVGFLIVVAYSVFKLQEGVTAVQLGGVALIAVGVVMVASNL